jgi:hypothetical protein
MADRLTDRLWRVRRQHHHVDASLSATSTGWALRFDHDDRPLFTWTFDDPVEARALAERKLKELQRAGWTVHW